jgi:hypothetical protein
MAATAMKREKHPVSGLQETHISLPLSFDKGLKRPDQETVRRRERTD